jgi:hypothetical protein
MIKKISSKLLKTQWLAILLVALSACTGSQKAPESRSPLAVSPRPVDAELTTENGQQILRGPSVLLEENRFIWGGSVVKGADGRYHMFFSTWDCGPDSLTFTQTWVLNSEIGYAVSDLPDRDFKIQTIFLKGRRHEGDTTAWDAQMVHNPHIRKFGDKYYLYYIGAVDPGRPAPGEPGAELSKRDRVQQSQLIGVIEFDDFADILTGDFERPDDPLLTPRTRVKPDNVINPSPAGTKALPDNLIVTNPSIVFRPSDQKYLLYFKGNWYTPTWQGIHGVAIGDSPTGPFVTQDEIMFDVKMEDGRTVSTEDPYVWYHPGHERFYAVAKDFPGRISGEKYGLALLQSKDGIQWTAAERPKFMDRAVPLKDGQIIKPDRLERPQLLIDERGTPTVFYGACSIEPANQKVTGGTFNVQIALGVE